MRYRASYDDPLIYHVDPDKVGEELMKKWMQLKLDDETQEFIDNSNPSIVKDFAASILQYFVSRTDANGYVGRGRMFVLSRKNFIKVCGLSSSSVSSGSLGKVLDIGSGDGYTTEKFSSLFNRVVTTEESAVMARRLRARGWECLEPSKDKIPDELFDYVTCLNVLDRADKPLELLESLKLRLAPETGILVLAVVLPWCPFVESGTRKLPPTQVLDGMKGYGCKDGASFEISLRALVEKVLVKIDFEVVSISRVPYLSQGDQFKRYYSLSDAIIVCKRKR